MPAAKSKRTAIVSAALAGGALGIFAVAGYMSMHDHDAAPSTTKAEAHETTVSWCASGLDPIAGGGCFAAPPSADNAPLVVYLHDAMSPQSAGDELERQSRIARLGVERGFAVLALRGDRGECKTPQFAEAYCFPSNVQNAEDAPKFIVRFQTALDEAARRTNGTPHRYLLGFSNGGYFADIIATRALLPFDAVAIAHAGPAVSTRPMGATPPLLLISADDDPSDSEVAVLDRELLREGWAHSVVGREGGHALSDWDVEMALTFFQRAQTEPMPLSPPLARGRKFSSQDEDTGTAVTAIADVPTNQAPLRSPPPRARVADIAAPTVNEPPQEPIAMLPAPPPQPTSVPPPPAREEPQPPQATPAGVSTSPPAGVSTSPPAGVPTDQVPSQPYWPY